MEKSIDFYTRIIGLKLLRREEIPENNVELAFLQDPSGKGAVLELAFYSNQTHFEQVDYKDRLFDHLAFVVKNMEETRSMLQREFVTMIPHWATGASITFLEDPDGTLVELIERR
jgi:lactoylglutathione lyase